MFEVKRGVLSGKADLCIPMSGNANFLICGWLMGLLPYGATKCTANKKKTTRKSLLPGTKRHSLSQWNSVKKSTRTTSADFRAHRRCLLILPRHDQGRSNLCVVRLFCSSQTEVKTKRQNHLRHANIPKKEKGMRIESRKSQAGVI